MKVSDEIAKFALTESTRRLARQDRLVDEIRVSAARMLGVMFAGTAIATAAATSQNGLGFWALIVALPIVPALFCCWNVFRPIEGWESDVQAGELFRRFAIDDEHSAMRLEALIDGYSEMGRLNSAKLAVLRNWMTWFLRWVGVATVLLVVVAVTTVW